MLHLHRRAPEHEPSPSLLPDPFWDLVRDPRDGRPACYRCQRKVRSVRGLYCRSCRIIRALLY